jgi:GNAT superfamily N-acetyltransferase
VYSLAIDESLEIRVHRNLIEANALMAERVERHDGALMFATRSEMPLFNGVLREPHAGDAGALLDRAREFFFGLGRGFVVFTWPGDPGLVRATEAAAMLPVIERYPEMTCRARLPEIAADVVPVTDLRGAAAYWSLCDEAYPSLGFPAGLFAKTFTPDQLLEIDDLHACIARDETGPAGCALVWVRDRVGFIGWVASAPRARGRGYAAACTVWATNRAFELGADVVSLQASPMGEDLYRRLGYECLFSYRVMGALAPPLRTTDEG